MSKSSGGEIESDGDLGQQQETLIRRAAALLNVLADAEPLKIVRGG